MSINFQFGNPEKKLLGCTIANQRKSIIFAKYRMRLGYFTFGESSSARKKFEKNSFFSTFSLACTTIYLR